MSEAQMPVCPMCSKRTLAHCTGLTCGWIVCQGCMIVFGPRSSYCYGGRAKKQADSERRRNGK